MLDLHHLGLRQTGNETWARCIGAALFQVAGPQAYDIAITAAAPVDVLATLPARQRVTVSGSNARRLVWDLPRALRAAGSDALLVQYVAPLTRVPTVVAVHDLSFEHSASTDWLPAATRLRYRTSIRDSVRRAAHVLVLSASTRDDLVGCYGLDPARVSVVPAAVDPLLHAEVARTAEDREGPLTVLVVGNVLPRKNVVTAARAVRVLRDRGHDVRLRVVGTVPEAGRVDMSRVNDLLGENVVWSGHVDTSELARAYRSAHVLAFPSLFEGFGIPVVEAMAAGLPVVASDRTSLPEVVGEAGLVVPADDPGAWADALWSVLDASRTNELREAGVAWAAGFSWDHSARLVADVLARVRSRG